MSADYHYNKNNEWVRYKRNIQYKSDEELKGLIAKKWKPAKTLEEAKERATIAFEEFKKTDHALNAVFTIFKKSPELLLFKDIAEKITAFYENAHISMYSKADEQLCNFDKSIARLSIFAKRLYSNLLDKAQTQPTQEPIEPKPVQQRKHILKRKTLTPTLRERCKDDSTPLQNLFDTQSLAEMEPLFAYLANKQVKTVGEFMKYSDMHSISILSTILKPHMTNLMIELLGMQGINILRLLMRKLLKINI